MSTEIDMSAVEGNVYDDENGSDNDILYGDLNDTGRSADLVKMAQRIEELTKKNESIANDLQETKVQLQVILNEKEILEKNIVVLYNTAVREIERKDKQIAEFRTKELQASATSR